MGVKEQRDAFNEVAGQVATCVKSFMETLPGGIQKLYFSGNYANGEGFAIESEPVPPSGDMVLASRATAEALLAKQRAT